MTVLGINCATENLSLALLLPTGKCLEKNWPGQTIKTENLLVYLQELLAEAGATLKQIRKIGIAIGPGAFTGLRLSLITAKILALELKVPLVPISTLLALAWSSREKSSTQNKIRIILKACRGEHTTALFSRELKQLEPDHADKIINIKDDTDTFTVIDPIASAAAIAELAQNSPEKFDKTKIMALVPQYSHEARVNLSAKAELQHLKIAKSRN